ncbi:uncharacterized protein LOC119103080 [Pollicipes pollicipes]|uniref:uncharacterized protein LOC119103080 n=1 Tax=Pollicipes pollicipes TaxID=41117 RepID=UPI001884E814|nr:uncharacterized protein LOC119103080 [Pollicipes pollicipes]
MSATAHRPWNAMSATAHRPRNVMSANAHRPRNAMSATAHRPWKATSANAHRPRNAMSATAHRPRNVMSVTAHRPRNTMSATAHRPWKAKSATAHRPRNAMSATAHRPWNTMSATAHRPWKAKSANAHRPRNAMSAIAHRSRNVMLAAAHQPPCAFTRTSAPVLQDLYTLTLLTHARAVAGRLDEARFGLTELKSRATRDEGLVYWRNEGSGENRALSVEMGAYNILTMKLVEKAGDDSSEHFSDALGAVRWITQQCNSPRRLRVHHAVLALEALAVFSADLPRLSSADLRVHVSDDSSLNDIISVTADNQLLMQTRDITLLQVTSTSEPGHRLRLVQVSGGATVLNPRQ